MTFPPGGSVAYADVRQRVDLHPAAEKVLQQLPPEGIGEGILTGAAFLRGADEDAHPVTQGHGGADHLLVPGMDHLKPAHQDAESKGLHGIHFLSIVLEPF